MYEEILGGLSKDFKHETKEQYVGGYSVGNNALFNIKNNIMDWKLLNKILNQNPIEDANDNKLVIQNVNDILNLTEYIDNSKTLCLIIKEIYNLPDKDLIKVLSKSLNIDESLKHSLRKLYVTWYDLIEYLLNILMQTLEIEYDPDLEIVTNLSNITNAKISKINIKFKKQLDHLLNLFDKYEHKGYCPCEPVKRILALFKFPSTELIAYLKTMDKTLFIGVDFSDIYKEISSIVSEIDLINNKLILPISNRQKLPDNNSKNYDILLKEYTDIFIELYKVVYPILEQKENQYIEISKKNYKICNIVETLIKLI